MDSKSQEETEEIKKMVIKNFVFCYQKVFEDLKIHWQLKTNNHPVQDDFNSCGLFVLHFIRQILQQNLQEMEPCNPQAMRLELQRNTVQHSISVKNLCLICGTGSIRGDSRWVMCELCKKWSHFRCLDFLNKSFDEVSNENFIYKCDLCLQFEGQKVML